MPAALPAQRSADASAMSHALPQRSRSHGRRLAAALDRMPACSRGCAMLPVHLRVWRNSQQKCEHPGNKGLGQPARVGTRAYEAIQGIRRLMRLQHR